MQAVFFQGAVQAIKLLLLIVTIVQPFTIFSVNCKNIFRNNVLMYALLFSVDCDDCPDGAKFVGHRYIQPMKA